MFSHLDIRSFIFREPVAAGAEERKLSTFDRNNALSVILMGALPPIAGSAISFLLAAFFLWGLVSLVLGRFEFRLTHSDRVLAWTFTIFAASILATGLLGKEPLRVFGSAVWLLPFLSLWVVIPRLRASPQLDYLRLYISGAMAGCVGALLLVCAHIIILDTARSEGGAGNPAVFASMCLCLVGFAGLALVTPDRVRRFFAVFAVFCGTVALLLSLTRGVILALVPVLVLLLVYAWRRWPPIRFRWAVLLMLIVPCLVLYGTWNVIEDRIVYTFREVAVLLDGGYTSSMGERLRLWPAAWKAFLDAPLWGYGVQERMEAMMPYLADGRRIVDMTHPHNGFLTFALDGGVVVLAALLAVLTAPVVLARQAARDNRYHRRLFMALILSTTYVTVGLTQIIFKNDILDSFYIFTAIVLAASIPDPAARPVGGADAKSGGWAQENGAASGVINRLFDITEAYVFPGFVLVLVMAGLAQSLFPSSAKRMLTSLLGL